MKTLPILLTMSSIGIVYLYVARWAYSDNTKVKESAPHQCHIDTVYVQDDTIIDSLQELIRNQDRYILVIENENQILGSYRAQNQ